jgi:hypothetical protein
VTTPEGPRPEDFEYFTLRAETHEQLTELLNDAAEHCWEPVLYSIWSLGTGAGTSVEAGMHFVVIRRNTTYFQGRLEEVKEGLRNGEYREKEDEEWAREFLERARTEGYDDASA